MSKRYKFLLAAVVLIAGTGTVLANSSILQGRFGATPTPASTTISLGTSATTVNLTADNSVSEREIVYGVDTGILEFTLTAKAAYTLRQISFDISSSGLDGSLDDFTTYKVYKVVSGSVDYSTLIGEGISIDEDGGHLIVQMCSNCDTSSKYGYIGSTGTTSYVLTATVLDDGTDNINTVTSRLSNSDWSWRGGEATRRWAVYLSGNFDESHVSGLPTIYTTSN